MKKKIKHVSRKVTPEQVAAMNRELELRCADHHYVRDQNGRLVRQANVYLGWW